MAKEKCVRRSFQDSLEDIKERMKEKRTKKLAKVATVNKGLSSKVKIMNNSSVTVKSFQANNKALALALEAEKCKNRQFQDLVLHLKGEHQRQMFEIFVLRRKLNMQQCEKLASLKEIISKVTHNLLETANLLGPAHALCSSDGASIIKSKSKAEATSSKANPRRISADSPACTSASRGVKRSTLPVEAPEPLAQMCELASDAPRNITQRGSIPGRSRCQEESSENRTTGNRLSKARTSSSCRRKSDLGKAELDAEHDNSYFKNVSIRRRATNLNVCIEEPSMVKSLEEEQNLHSRCDVSEEIVPADECCNDEVMDLYPDLSPAKEEFISFTNHCQISSSTPEPKPKQSQALKGKTESRAGREKVRKGKADGQAPVQLKKPWEKSKPRARSKSRERGANKQTLSKDKMNASLNSGDAYDFLCEESIHLTPFKLSKLGSDPEENEEPVNDQSTKSSSGGDEELNDSLYVPTKAKAKNTTSLPLRPRSKRNKNLQQQCDERTENKSGEQDKPDVARRKRSTRSGIKGSVEAEITPSVPDERTAGSKENVFLPKCIKTQENCRLNRRDQAVQENPLHSTDRNLCEFEGTSAAQRISLSNVTNLSRSSESKKHSFPFSEDNRKMSEGSTRKRRCTVTVNYAEPSLSRKLRRGDPFTDSEFLLSPVFKNGNSKRQSINRKSLARYNEAFVGCR